MMLMDNVETLIGRLKTGDDWTRTTATYTLGEIRDARAVEPLIEALKDKDAEVRRLAFFGLIKFGELAVKPLVDASRKKGNEALRGTIADILERIDWSAQNREQQDFGVREKKVIRALKVPDEFRNAMLDATPVKAKA